MQIIKHINHQLSIATSSPCLAHFPLKVDIFKVAVIHFLGGHFLQWHIVIAIEHFVRLIAATMSDELQCLTVPSFHRQSHVAAAKRITVMTFTESVSLGKRSHEQAGGDEVGGDSCPE